MIQQISRAKGGKQPRCHTLKYKKVSALLCKSDLPKREPIFEKSFFKLYSRQAVFATET